MTTKRLTCYGSTLLAASIIAALIASFASINPAFAETSPSCRNHTLDADETDVDCGGSCPKRCGLYQACNDNNDCASRNCDDTKMCGKGKGAPKEVASNDGSAARKRNARRNPLRDNPPLPAGNLPIKYIPACKDNDEKQVVINEGDGGDKVVWIGKPGKNPPADVEHCPEGYVPIVCQSNDKWRNAKNPTAQEASQYALDSSRALACAPPNWDGLWRRGVCASLIGSAKVACVPRARLCAHSQEEPTFDCAAAIKKGTAFFNDKDYLGAIGALENAYINGCRDSTLFSYLANSYQNKAENKCDHADDLERAEKYYKDYIGLLEASNEKDKSWADGRLAKIAQQREKCQPCPWVNGKYIHDPTCQKPPDPRRYVQLELGPDFGGWGSTAFGNSPRADTIAVGGGLELAVLIGPRLFVKAEALFGASWPGEKLELRGFGMHASAGIGIRLRPDMPGEVRLAAIITYNMRTAYQPNHPEEGEGTRNRAVAGGVEASVRLVGGLDLWGQLALGSDSHPMGAKIDDSVVLVPAVGLRYLFRVVK